MTCVEWCLSRISVNRSYLLHWRCWLSVHHLDRLSISINHRHGLLHHWIHRNCLNWYHSWLHRVHHARLLKVCNRCFSHHICAWIHLLLRHWLHHHLLFIHYFKSDGKGHRLVKKIGAFLYRLNGAQLSRYLAVLELAVGLVRLVGVSV